MFAYETYGLRIRSDVRLHDLPFSPVPSHSSEHYDVLIGAGTVATPAPDHEPDGQGCWQADRNEAFYHWDGVGSLLIEKGERVTYDIHSGADEVNLHLALLGPALATILHQRGLLVLHASAVRTDSGIVGFVASSGGGKSTTASALVEHGFELFTDDLLAIDLNSSGPPVTFPGPPQLKLWPPSAEALGYSPDALPRLGANHSKRVRHVDSARKSSRERLSRIYLIRDAGPPAVAHEARSEAMMELMTHSYCSEVLRHCGDRENFLQCAELLRRVPVMTLLRGESLLQLPALVEAIVRDLST